MTGDKLSNKASDLFAPNASEKDKPKIKLSVETSQFMDGLTEDERKNFLKKVQLSIKKDKYELGIAGNHESVQMFVEVELD